MPCHQWGARSRTPCSVERPLVLRGLWQRASGAGWRHPGTGGREGGSLVGIPEPLSPVQWKEVTFPFCWGVANEPGRLSALTVGVFKKCQA